MSPYITLELMFLTQVGSVDHFRMVLATSQLWDRRNTSLIHGLQGSSLLTMT